MADPTEARAKGTSENPWSLADDCARVRDLARQHGFAIRSRDAREIWERHSRQARSPWLPLPEGDAALFAALVEPLHEWLAEDTEPAPVVREGDGEQPALGRPALIDEQADGPCEICAAWSARRGQRDAAGAVIVPCEECGCRIPEIPGIGGIGIQGTVPHHYHLSLINGSAPGRKGVFQTLCKECAIALRLKVYPPDEKDRFGNFHPTADAMRNYAG